MELRFLDFDYSEDDAGRGLFDALASVRPEQLPALQAEVEAVLAWAHQAFGAPAPLDEDGEWDLDLAASVETSLAQRLAFDGDTGRLTMSPGAAGMPRHVWSLSLTGTPAFCDALRQRFSVED